MTDRLALEILSQPDDTTCGPTCLHALYRYWDDSVALDDLIEQVPALPTGGTLGVHLATHALRRGYDAHIYTYNLQLFDPTWLAEGVDLAERLRRQRAFKTDPRLREATDAYLEALEVGARITLEDLTPALIRRHLRRGEPVLTGLSSTFLYRSSRETPADDVADDVRGEPVGHFVILCDYDTKSRQVGVADPYEQNPVAPGQHYSVSIERLVGAILLGVLTYDANLIVIRPGRARRGSGSGRVDAKPDRRQ